VHQASGGESCQRLFFSRHRPPELCLKKSVLVSCTPQRSKIPAKKGRIAHFEPIITHTLCRRANKNGLVDLPTATMDILKLEDVPFDPLPEDGLQKPPVVSEPECGEPFGIDERHDFFLPLPPRTWFFAYYHRLPL
jgi:hypothetical protein